MIKTLRNLFKQDKEKFIVPKSVQAESTSFTFSFGFYSDASFHFCDNVFAY